MKVFYGRTPAGGLPGRTKVTLGTFDGVHLGHQRVLRDLLAWARATDCAAAVVTFDRTPRRVLAGESYEQITSLPHRVMLFERLGIDATLVLRFDEALAAREPATFARDIFVEQLDASGVLLGHDTHFGRGARGDLDFLIRLGKASGFEVRAVPVVELDGKLISSTRVRQAIQSGDLWSAERMLGRCVSVLGSVVEGTGRGKSAGYPTANLDLHHEVRPPEGVYASRALLEGVLHDSVTNIGRPPALEPAGPEFISDEVVVETHLFDFSGDLYGKDLEVRFVGRLRPERTFHSTKALVEQVAADIDAARRRLAEPASGRESHA